MYVLAPNQTVQTFPYSLEALKRDNPNVSFPRTPSNEALAEHGVFPVVAQEPPTFDIATQDVTQLPPSLVDGEWRQNWQITDLTAEQGAERTATEALAVRADRTRRLAACDWTQLADSPLDADAKAAWALYRETLRMVPQQAGFPWEVQWPEQPQ
jgi:hypothetical protein